MSAILDLDELLTRMAHLIKRVIDYSIFGIALLNEDTETLELKIAHQVRRRPARDGAVKLGEGLVGYAALHKEVVLVPGRDEGSALHQRDPRRPLRAGRPAAR